MLFIVDVNSDFCEFCCVYFVLLWIYVGGDLEIGGGYV